MGFKTVSDLSTDNAIALGGFNKKTRSDNPTTITGYFIGSKEVDSPKSKTGKAKLHVFQTATGNVGVWGKTDLDQKLRNATPGALTRVTFTGMQETKNNPMYKYKVEVDTDDSIEVAEQAAGGDAPLDSGAAYAGGSDDYADIDSEDDLDVLPPPPARRPTTPASVPTAEAQAQVQAMLGKRK